MDPTTTDRPALPPAMLAERVRRLRELREATNAAWWHAPPASAERDRLARQEAAIARELADAEAANGGS
jgi:hypothetical protein